MTPTLIGLGLLIVLLGAFWLSARREVGRSAAPDETEAHKAILAALERIWEREGG